MSTSSKKQSKRWEKFKQQELPTWQPVLTPVAVIAMLLGIFVVFLPIGIVLEDASNDVVEQSFQYDIDDICGSIDANTDPSQLPISCNFTFTLNYDMKAPIYFYYELRKFYQNHRRVLGSKSDAQLRGDGNDVDISLCEPQQTERYRNKIIVPCGLSAAVFFQDRFNLAINGEYLCDNAAEGDPCYGYPAGDTENWNNQWSAFHQDESWQKKGIAWQSDTNVKFAYNEINNATQTNRGPRQVQSGLHLPRVDDEDFIVWMRPAALPNFRKLHRIIKDRDLMKGDNITIQIYSWFATKEFGSQKWITLGKPEWCGGANHSLARIYIAVACIAIGLTVTFAILMLFGSRKMANVERLQSQST